MSLPGVTSGELAVGEVGMVGVDDEALFGQQLRASVLKNEIAALPSLAGFSMGGSVSRNGGRAES